MPKVGSKSKRKYQLILGDCLEKMKDIKPGSVDMVLTDPPYGTTACKWDSVIPLQPMWEQLNRIIKPNGAIVITASQPFTTILISSNLTVFKYCWVWEKSKKTGFLNAKKQPLRTTEDVCVFYKRQSTYNPQMKKVKKRFVSRSGGYSRDGIGYGDHRPVSSSNGGLENPFNLVQIKSEGKPVHPTQKPVALMEYLIKTYTNESDTVLDFTMGSGTTGVACGNLNRKFIGIELDETYFEDAKKRIEEAYA